MLAAYFHEFVTSFGQGWNRFWYTPAHPLPLGLMRILTGLIAIAWLVGYTPDIDLLLSESGIMPRSLVVDLQTVQTEKGDLVRPWRFSYLDYLGGQDLRVAHWCGIAVLVAYTLGLYSRFTSIAALVVVLSYLHRTPIVTMYHERILAFLMFYLTLGPSGATLSLDRLLAARKGAQSAQPSWSANVVLRLIQVHFAVVCFMMAISKLSIGATEWWSGLAIWWLSLQPDAPLVTISWSNTPYDKFLINFWSHAIVFYELAFPIVCWKPVGRPIVVVLGILVWLSMIVATGQVLFGLSLIAALMSLVSGEQLLALASCCGCVKAKGAVAAGR